MNKEKMNEILTAAERLFNRFGIGKTAVEEIADEAGVAKGTIYNNFGSKAGVINAIIKEKLTAFERGTEKMTQEVSDPVKGLQMLVTERIRILTGTPFLVDGSLKKNTGLFKKMQQQVEEKFHAAARKVMEQGKNISLPGEEREKILTTISYTVRGIEESLRGAFSRVSSEKIREETDFLISRLFPRKNN